MSVRSLFSGFAPFRGASAGGGGRPAEAQQRPGYRSRLAGHLVRVQGEDGRMRTRILVQPRSYLDGGTEVLPGQRKYTDYVMLPGQRPFDVLGPGATATTVSRSTARSIMASAGTPEPPF